MTESLVVPAMNALWFWFDKRTRRELHGTPPDVMRKHALLKEKDFPFEGLEIFLMPSRLSRQLDFTNSFVKEFRELKFKSIHIAETEAEFLLQDDAALNLQKLFDVLTRLETSTIILHAHHLRCETKQKCAILLDALPGITICIENNGFDNPWGAGLEGLKHIFGTCPDLKFCLDLAHVKDFREGSLDAFLEADFLMERLVEIHWSCSTITMDHDPYPDHGHQAHGAYHGVFPACGIEPSARTASFACGYPVVMEGIVPTDDADFDLLRMERELIRTKGKDGALRHS
jgi:hypothetical protein